MLFPVLLIFFSSLLTPSSQQLVAVRVNARLPTARTGCSAIYDGDDTIYVVGGLDDGQPIGIVKDILAYKISTDSVTLMATLAAEVLSNNPKTSIDAQGNIYIYTGSIFGYGKVHRFDPRTSDVVEMASLPYSSAYSAVVKYSTTSTTVYLMGANTNTKTIVSYSMGSSSTNVVGNLTVAHLPMTAVSDGNASAFIFGREVGALIKPETAVAKINLATLAATFGPETLPYMYGTPTSVWDGKNAYIIGGYGNDSAGQYTHTIGQFDPVTMRVSMLPVTNFPANGTHMLDLTTAVYVNRLNRIYLFGGQTSYMAIGNFTKLSGIWYIDLSPLTPTTTTPRPSSTTTTTRTTTTSTTTSTTTPPPTTTLCPDVLSCVGKEDGTYPHPFDCAKFIRCLREVLTEMTCPEPLLYDPNIGACNFPEVVDCDETCIDY
ncbi:Endochitinase [Folsomia candida]|uniref:Endochitinase n=1 Tax=Folsomia candida TaxID=158441 RepID=A0A226F038_FOLCA|nr:Endochitinase [Folsomia candida]